MRNILLKALTWYYFDALKEILKGWRNFLVFGFNYFSVFTLLKTFFSPWHRYYYSYGKGFSFKKYFNILTFNLMSRTIGAILRTGLLVLGVLTEVLLVAAGFLVVMGWILLPLILFSLLVIGVKLLL